METKIITFCNALEEKYSIDKLDDEFENIYIDPKRRSIILNQQNHINRLNLALDGCKINNPGEKDEIKKICPNIKELDISNNQLFHLHHILEITKQLRNLTFLNLSHNILRESYLSENHDYEKQFSLKKLILTKTGTQFESLFKLLQLFPSVEELHISLNNLNTVPDVKKVFYNVETLHFADNGVTSWNQIEKLGQLFNNLKSLYIGENPIASITTIDSNAASLLFPRLIKLSLTKTLISEWSCVEKLNDFPSLDNVRFCGIPLLRTFKNDKERHCLLMVRLPKLKYINGSQVHESERECAERMFLRYFMKQKCKPKCFDRLFQMHGLLDELADVDMDKVEYVNLTLRGDIEKPLILQLDVSMSYYDLQVYIAKKTNLPVKSFRLVAVHLNDKSDSHVLWGKTARLRSSFLEDGDELILQKKSI